MSPNAAIVKWSGPVLPKVTVLGKVEGEDFSCAPVQCLEVVAVLMFVVGRWLCRSVCWVEWWLRLRRLQGPANREVLLQGGNYPGGTRLRQKLHDGTFLWCPCPGQGSGCFGL